MSGEYDPQFQSLQMQTCTPKLIVKTTMKHEGNFEPTSRTFVGHGNLSLNNSQDTMFQISVGDSNQNLEIESMEVLQQYTIAALE